MAGAQHKAEEKPAFEPMSRQGLSSRRKTPHEHKPMVSGRYGDRPNHLDSEQGDALIRGGRILFGMLCRAQESGLHEGPNTLPKIIDPLARADRLKCPLANTWAQKKIRLMRQRATELLLHLQNQKSGDEELEDFGRRLLQVAQRLGTPSAHAVVAEVLMVGQNVELLFEMGLETRAGLRRQIVQVLKHLGRPELAEALRASAPHRDDADLDTPDGI